MGRRTRAAFGSAGAVSTGLVALVCLASACTGVIDQRTSGTHPVGPTGPGGSTQLADGSFLCDPAAGPSVSPLRRLSVLQYQNTLRDLFGAKLDVAMVASAEIARLPVDDAQFTIMDTRLSDQHVRAYYRVADKIATAATTADATLTAIAGKCALDAAPAP